MPAEIKIELLSYIPIKEWKTLAKLSKEWRKVVAFAANPHLNKVMNKLQPILSQDFGAMMKTLLSQVEYYSSMRKIGNVFPKLNT